MRPGHRLDRAHRTLGYAAVWPALYALGVYLLATLSLDVRPPNARTIAYILLIGHACYLLDRVKISDRRQDPADAVALPDRAMLFSTFARRIRLLVVLELVASAIVGWPLHPVMAMIPIAALVVVHLYAGRGATPGSPRFKDLPALKAFMISSGHLALTVSLLWANDHLFYEHLRWRALLIAAGIWLIVSGDAVLCDLDDEHADRAYGTNSLPVLMGPDRAWLLALAIITAGSAALSFSYAHAGASGVVAALLVLSTLLVRKNPNQRDFVDARLLPIVLIGMWVAGNIAP